MANHNHHAAGDLLVGVDNSIRMWAYTNAYTLIFCSVMMITILAVWCGITLGGGVG